MNGFQPAEKQVAFLKAGLYGPQGSGKTFTSALLMMGLHQKCKAQAPVAMFDTESGASYIAELYKTAGIPFVVWPYSRSFAELAKALKEIERGDYFGFIVDSIGHPWEELMQAAKVKAGVTRLSYYMFGPIKERWNEEFALPWVNAKVHCVICGRVRAILEEEVDEKGVKTLTTVGTQMKTEKELGYESSLLVEMDRELEEDKKKNTYMVQKAVIIKDRFNAINGQCFRFDGRGKKLDALIKDTFTVFLPHINKLNLGGQGVTISTESSTAEGFSDEGNKVAYELHRQHDIAFEEFKNELDSRFPNRKEEDKKLRLEWEREHCGTTSATKIESFTTDKLRDLLAILRGEAAIDRGGEGIREG